jgi:hypothetical protein
VSRVQNLAYLGSLLVWIMGCLTASAGKRVGKPAAALRITERPTELPPSSRSQVALGKKKTAFE